MMNFGKNYLKSVRVNEKKKTDDKPYKLTIIPTLIDWIQQALVGGCNLSEVKSFGLPHEAYIALQDLNTNAYFESGTLLRLRVTPQGSMCIDEQSLAKDTNASMKLKDNMKLEWQISRRSNQATDALRTILKYFPNVLINYHRTCLQAMREMKISRIGELENDARKYLELVYALDLHINWDKSNDIDYLAYRSGMSLESIIASLDSSKGEAFQRTTLAMKLDDQNGRPHKKIRAGLFPDPTSGEYVLGVELINLKNDRDVSVRFVHRIFDIKTGIRSVTNKNNFLDDEDEADELAYDYSTVSLTSNPQITKCVKQDRILEESPNKITSSAPSIVDQEEDPDN